MLTYGTLCYSYVSTLTLSLKLRVLKLASDSLCIPGGRDISALNFMKRMLDACVSSTIRVALGKHLSKKRISCTRYCVRTFSRDPLRAMLIHSTVKDGDWYI